jgi:hypothetical protein
MSPGACDGVAYFRSAEDDICVISKATAHVSSGTIDFTSRLPRELEAEQYSFSSVEAESANFNSTVGGQYSPTRALRWGNK